MHNFAPCDVLAVECRGGETVAVGRDCAIKCGYLLGIIEDVEETDSNVSQKGAAVAVEDITYDSITLKAPLEAEALRAVVRILRGDRVDLVCEWGYASVNSLFSCVDEHEKADNARRLSGLVEVLTAASYLHAPAVEDAVSQHFASVIKETCSSGSMVRTACALLPHVQPTIDEAAFITELLAQACLIDPDALLLQRRAGGSAGGRSSDGDGTPSTLANSTSPIVSPPTSVLPCPLWWAPSAGPFHDAGRCAGDDKLDDSYRAVSCCTASTAIGSAFTSTSVPPLEPWWATISGSLHGALCLAALDTFNATSPLRCLSFDVLVSLIRKVRAALVPLLATSLI